MAGLLMACSPGPSEAPPRSAEGTPAPRLILTPPSFERVTPLAAPTFAPLVFEGSQDFYTPLFAVTSGRWRIEWTVKSFAPEHMLFALAVYPKGPPGEAVAATESRGQQAGTLEVESGPGEYYVRVFTANVESWMLEVSQ